MLTARGPYWLFLLMTCIALSNVTHSDQSDLISSSIIADQYRLLLQLSVEFTSNKYICTPATYALCHVQYYDVLTPTRLHLISINSIDQICVNDINPLGCTVRVCIQLSPMNERRTDHLSRTRRLFDFVLLHFQQQQQQQQKGPVNTVTCCLTSCHHIILPCANITS